MKRTPFDQPSNLFEAQIRDAFKRQDQDDIDYILKVSTLFIYSNPDNTDLVDLHKLVGLETFVKIIHLFDGRTIKFPSSAEMREVLLASICYYYRQVKGMSWPQIKEMVPFDLSSISLGVRIKGLNSFIRKQINQSLAEYTGTPEDDNKDTVEDMLEGLHDLEGDKE